MSISTNSNFENKNNEEYRCPTCSLIPFIYISVLENKLFMSTKCTNEYNYSDSFEEKKKLCKVNPVSNCLCELCEDENNKNNKNNSNIFYYCSKCFKFIF